MKTLIKNGRVIDPANGIDAPMNILIENGKIISVSEAGNEDADKIIDASDCWVVPGLIDMHVHLRDPGQLHKETIKTGTRAAAAGGFTTVCCMPNTSPVIDSAETVKYINETAVREGAVRVLPVGSITRGLAGESLSEIQKMKQAGICAISDDGKTVENPALFVAALKLAKELNLPVLSHCEPEDEITERDIKLAKETGAKLHICHVSTAKSVELIRAAQKAGQPVTAEVTPHHFTLTQNDNPNGKDPNFKMAPPLRTPADRAAIIAALKDGTIAAIATDHAPHHENEKNVGYENAANGIIGLETAVALAISELAGVLTPLELVAKFTSNPAKILGLDLGHLSVGATADITIIDPAATSIIDKAKFESLSKNTPFHGREVTGRVVCTIIEGETICLQTA
ncbi:MAG: dihydroorotase [Defluviitaleaceae bacterium]|nr:dihydroorotase [Defluviitaleaceae bacterium]MCL2262598.1 dihydroorotase [Defluviitaleaceae bacterium]